MRILIVGCGYVGSAAARHWKGRGFFVAATTRSQERAAQLQQVANKVVHLAHPDDLIEAIKTGGYHSILFSVAAKNREKYRDAYLDNASRIVKALQESPTVRQILYTGSTSVYGDQNGKTVTEKSPLNPANEQAKILVETENILLNAKNEQTRVCIFRLGQIVGPERTLQERLLKMYDVGHFSGNPEQISNLSPLEDIVLALDFALLKGLNGVYNLCNDCHYPRQELYALAAKRAGIPPLKWESSKTESPHGGNRRVSNAKIKQQGFHFSEYSPH